MSTWPVWILANMQGAELLHPFPFKLLVSSRLRCVSSEPRVAKPRVCVHCAAPAFPLGSSDHARRRRFLLRPGSDCQLTAPLREVNRFVQTRESPFLTLYLRFFVILWVAAGFVPCISAFTQHGA